jgi:hypothetical protein
MLITFVVAANALTTKPLLIKRPGDTRTKPLPSAGIEISIPAEGNGLVLIAPGILINNGLLVRAFAGTTNVINIFGYVNRIV